MNGDKMSERISWIRKGMFFVNVCIVFLFFFIISYTTNHICTEFHAREFIEQAQYLPLLPERMLAFVLGFLGLIAMSNIIKEKVKDNILMVTILLGFDFLICFMLVYYMNLSYRGIYLVFMTNVFLYTKENIYRAWTLVAVLVVYTLSDYELFVGRLQILSMHDYIIYNDSQAQFYMLAVKNLLISLNEIGFIVFLYFMLRLKINENKDIKKLNEQLRTTAAELEVANIHLKDYASTLEENTKMKERNRLAREIHDILGHSLTSITTGMEACIEILGINPDLAKTQLEKILDLSRKGLEDVRRSVKELKVDQIAKAQFIPAIKDLVKDINECTPVHVDLNIRGVKPKVKEDEEQIIYRIIQESLTNAIRHGKANIIKLNITFGDHELTIKVIDDGIGCEKVTEGFGLIHIKEWLNLLNGNLSYQTAPGEGFQLTVYIPIRWGEAYD